MLSDLSAILKIYSYRGMTRPWPSFCLITDDFFKIQHDVRYKLTCSNFFSIMHGIENQPTRILYVKGRNGKSTWQSKWRFFYLCGKLGSEMDDGSDMSRLFLLKKRWGMVNIEFCNSLWSLKFENEGEIESKANQRNSGGFCNF